MESAISTSHTGTMRAILQDSYGTPDVLRMGRGDMPTMGPKDVLVWVRAAGLDRGMWHLLTGRPYLMRVIGFGFSRPKNRVPGREVAGTVVAVGSAVKRFGPGDEVFGIGRGSFGEYAAAEEGKLARKPATCTFEQAAVAAVSGLTALRGLRGAGHLEAGQHVLIIGASGGVGSFAVQVAKALGVEITGVCSTSKVDLVRSLGADHVIDYTRQDFADGSHRYHFILDMGGNATLARLRRALAPRGTLVIVGGEGGGNLTGLGWQLRALVLSAFVSQRLTMLVPNENHTDLEKIAELIEAGTVTPCVDRTYTLDQCRRPCVASKAGQVRGKLAIAI